MAQRRSPKTKGRAKRVLQSKIKLPGWRTTDQEEIERRKLRALNERFSIEQLEPEQLFFGTFQVGSYTGDRSYLVEVRSLTEYSNSCECPDFRVSGLGTCKHIEATLARLRRGRIRMFRRAAKAGSPRVEVFLSAETPRQIKVDWSKGVADPVVSLISPFFSSENVLLADPVKAVPALKRAVESAPDGVREHIRIAQEVYRFASALRRRQDLQQAREAFITDIANGKRSSRIVKHALYDYQRAGMLHLAFGERVLLADEMGLGKTVQAIAACELLRQVRGIERVLIVCPASLKTEWEEQIRKFTDLPALLFYGSRANRLRNYRRDSFFYISNYEQIRVDVDQINATLAPDVVILDEAQRIKNWQTKTAKSVKQLASPYAFVLTGTPLENRIDEIYSIVEFLDPQVLGPLFQFNREFYELDIRGRPIGYKNLDELHRRIRPLMLRRRKDEVEDQLPTRIVNNYFVEMDAEQRARYEEYEARVARLLSHARDRSLTKEEMEQLQKWLACMRMLCDTPYILDSECRISPKLEELEAVLEEVLDSGKEKVLIFSEWERMLCLVRELAEEMGVEFAWHTGSVPQPKRRPEINRFKQDPDCRLFLSTDSGGTGLNLQAASVVINLDLPWNPAKLEQRIARAWRKYQVRPVSVINLVCQNSIEHRMLGLLSQKQQLADVVIDARSDLKSMSLPSGRAAFMERLQGLMTTDLEKVEPEKRPTRIEPGGDPLEILGENLVARMADRLLLLETRESSAGKTTVLAVVDDDVDRLKPLAERMLRESLGPATETSSLELVDRTTYETIQRLIERGMLRAESTGVREIHRSSSFRIPAPGIDEKLLQEARAALGQADRKMSMVELLEGGGFLPEAAAALTDSLQLALKALSRLFDEKVETEDGRINLDLFESRVLPKADLPKNALSLARSAAVLDTLEDISDEIVRENIAKAKQIIESIHIEVNRAALS